VYIPPKYEIRDWNEITSFVAKARAGEFVTVNSDGTPEASTLPFTWYPGTPDNDGVVADLGRVTTHMARSNNQWREIEDGAPALIIVHGAGAYISPNSYPETVGTGKVVGTWDYQVVHLRGTVEVLHDAESIMGIVSDLQRDHEVDRANPWDITTADQDFMQELIRHVVGFTVKVTSVEAKYKLDQKSSLQDRTAIVNDLMSSDRPSDRVVAEEMKRIFKF
jgi:transcriptional regulator